MITGHHDAEKHLVGARWRYMVRRFHQHIARVGERQQAARLQPRDKVRHEMHVRASHQLERHALAIKLGLKRGDRLSNLRAGIIVNARHDMRRAGENLYAAGRRLACHGNGNRQIGRAVVYSR